MLLTNWILENENNMKKAGKIIGGVFIALIFVVVAGALMNLLLGILIILGMVCSQNLVGVPAIADFDEDAVSSSVLRVDDRILAIDGMRVYPTTDISTGFSRSPDD